MLISMRASRLRDALEQATGTLADVAEVAPDRIRISAAIREEATLADFRRSLAAIQAGDDWGSSGNAGAVQVWAEVRGDAS